MFLPNSVLKNTLSMKIFSPALEGGVLTGIAEGDTSGAAGLELLDPRL